MAGTRKTTHAWICRDLSEVCHGNLCRERGVEENTRGAPRDIYKKGEAGWPVPGVQAPYEAPLDAELVIETDSTSLEDSLSAVYEFIAKRLSSAS